MEVSELLKYIPSDVVADAINEEGIGEIVFVERICCQASEGREIVGAYWPFFQEIEIDKNMDRQAVVKDVLREHGINIELDEAYLWTFFHELAHHKARMQGFSATEEQCEEFAINRYFAWRMKRRIEKLINEKLREIIDSCIHQAFKETFK